MEGAPTTAGFWRTVSVLAALLLAIQIAFLPRAGLEADEILFVAPFLKGITPFYSWTLPWHGESIRIPVMIMDYIGSLKSWLYWPIFHFWPPDVWTIRLPACLFSAATLMIFADAMRRAGGCAVAILATLLLATDASFILTNVYDWGPVVLLLLGMAAFLNLLHRYAAGNGVRYLGAAFFVAGLSIWNKAIFVFPFTGLLLALTIVYFREIRERLSSRTVGCILASFAAGVSPLIAFNAARHGATFTASSYIVSAPAAEKFLMLRRTLDGRALEHYMFRSFPHERIQLSGASVPDLVASWYRKSAIGPGSFLPELLLVSLLALPSLRHLPIFRPLLTAWIAAVTAFCLMLCFRDAGAGPHHSVLIYPAPHFIVAASLAGLWQRVPRAFRPTLIVLAFGLAFSNLYLLDRYYMAANQNGFSVYWTDSSRELSRVVKRWKLPVAFLDWGVRDVTRVESADSIAVATSDEPRHGILYVSHCNGYVIDEEQKLSPSTLRRIEVGRVFDKTGEPVFCLSLFEDPAL